MNNQLSEAKLSNKSVSDDERLWATLSHASCFGGLIIPFGSFIFPFLILLIKGKESSFVSSHAKEALNFQITATLLFILAWFLMFILIGFILLPIVAISWLGLMAVASYKVNSGEDYRYPFILRLIR